jgi:hypothetical protein
MYFAFSILDTEKNIDLLVTYVIKLSIFNECLEGENTKKNC